MCWIGLRGSRTLRFRQCRPRAEILMFEEDFTGRCLPFDGNCASEYALLVVERTGRGHPISTENGQIAAIALSHDLPLATRNGKDFEGIQRFVIILNSLSEKTALLKGGDATPSPAKHPPA
jgi:predicted nucleic acid-binding protein